ncbi:MAG: helix-hairpin-helix domain-containing protein [Clostridia bacterium]|nr:helix-hairpin-helix domain-containing protein [Clostridia bacterium]
MEKRKDFFERILIIIIILIIAICILVFYNQQRKVDVLYEDMELISETESDNNFTNINTENCDLYEMENETIKIYITGEVNNPGVKELRLGSRIEDAINNAGGLTDNANISQVNLAYSLEDGEKIYIPNINEKIDEYITRENGDGIVEKSNNQSSERININKADVNELCKLPGVGQSLAIRIVAYRDENGNFKTIDDLKNVSGIGEKKLESLKKYIVVK